MKNLGFLVLFLVGSFLAFSCGEEEEKVDSPALTAASTSIQAGECIEITLTVANKLTKAADFTLAATKGGTFSDSACGTAVTTTQIAADGTTSSFYFSSSTDEDASVTATADGKTATLAITLTYPFVGTWESGCVEDGESYEETTFVFTATGYTVTNTGYSDSSCDTTDGEASETEVDLTVNGLSADYDGGWELDLSAGGESAKALISVTTSGSNTVLYFASDATSYPTEFDSDAVAYIKQ